MKTKQSFSDFINETNLKGSGKASSYIRALDLLGEMLSIDSLGFTGGNDVWAITSESCVDDLVDCVKQEQAKGGDSVWLSTGIAPSYLTKGYCKAALNSYKQFLLAHNVENHLLSVFKSFDGNGRALAHQLYTQPDRLNDIAELVGKKRQGEDVVKLVKTRLNQRVFRQMIGSIYDHRCCITGLNISALNRASHIVSWADNEEARLDPSNGLYLSATYDAAFDRHLITLDDDYRIVLSSNLKAMAGEPSVRDYFMVKEGCKIQLPHSYLPSQDYLDLHRKACALP
mgnify:CR=1 FL=1